MCTERSGKRLTSIASAAQQGVKKGVTEGKGEILASKKNTRGWISRATSMREKRKGDPEGEARFSFKTGISGGQRI